MNKIILSVLILVAVFSFSACAKKPAAQVTPTNAPKNEQMQSNVATPDRSEAAEKPIATFAPTNDEDIKAMDKAIDAVNLNEYNTNSLDDLR